MLRWFIGCDFGMLAFAVAVFAAAAAAVHWHNDLAPIFIEKWLAGIFIWMRIKTNEMCKRLFYLR